MIGFELTEAERAGLVDFLHSLTDQGFPDDPAHADPWPTDHPARATRRDVVAAAPVSGAPAVVALALATLLGTALLRRAGDRRHHRDFDRELT